MVSATSRPPTARSRSSKAVATTGSKAVPRPSGSAATGSSARPSIRKRRTASAKAAVSADSKSSLSPHGSAAMRASGNAAKAASSRLRASGGGPQAPRDTQFLSARRYSDPAIKQQLSVATLKAIREDYGYVRLSKVQSATLATLMSGEDCFAKSKTGSGKTMAFLVPAIERAAKAPPQRRSQGGLPASSLDVTCLVVSPTKELATQTYVEAQKLLKYHAGLRAEIVIGGHPAGGDRARLSKPGRVAVLVGTPGRLCDHIESTPGFKDAMKRVATLVLDEADNLLDMGFKAQLDKIFAATSPARQTVLVSATMPEGVMALARKILKPSHKVIDVAGGQADAPRINPQVKHVMRVVDDEMYAHALAHELSSRAAKSPDLKCVVFFPTNVQTAFMAELFRRAFPRIDVLEIHGGLNLSRRERAAREFRTKRSAVLFTSDVSARGVDYPGVTLVVQMGVTTEEHYTHRLGRAGRAGMPGEGVLIVTPFEAPGMAKTLAKLSVPQEKYEGLKKSDAIGRAIDQVAGDPKLRKLAENAHRSWVGAYASRAAQLGVTKPAVLAEADRLFVALGLKSPPVISDKLKQKMGFR